MSIDSQLFGRDLEQSGCFYELRGSIRGGFRNLTKMLPVHPVRHVLLDEALGTESGLKCVVRKQKIKTNKPWTDLLSLLSV